MRLPYHEAENDGPAVRSEFWWPTMPLARRGVRQLLAPHSDITVVGESRNGPETLRALEALAPDLLFLDVQMPEMDGFEVIRARGAQQMAAVIFLTAHDQFAVRAFEAHALDYLVKPVNVARFEVPAGKRARPIADD